MDKIIYLDNSATTKPCDGCIKNINEALTVNWANPSSLYYMGLNAEKCVTSARKTIAKILNSEENEIYFTSCGSESNNTAIFSGVNKNLKRGDTVITSVAEHPSVLKCFEELEKQGLNVIRLPLNKQGVADLSKLEGNLNKNVIFVSLMMVNNEIGSINNIKAAADLVHKNCPFALFHTDSVQAFCKMDINVKKLGVDMLSFSGHKVHASKGIGGLYINRNIHIKPYIFGGGQERGFRSGTEAVPLIWGLKGALDEIGNVGENLGYIQKLNDYTVNKLASLPFVTINSPENALPYIINFSVEGIRSETMLHFLEERNIFVSSGSACAKGESSYVLRALGVNKNTADSAIRISFSRFNTTNDIDILYNALGDAYLRLAKKRTIK